MTATRLSYLWAAVMAGVFISSLSAQQPLSMVYPRSGQILSTMDSTIVLGQIRIPGARLHINGLFIPADGDGAFIGFLPIPVDSVRADSSFIFHCVVSTADAVFRKMVKVYIPQPATFRGVDPGLIVEQSGLDVDSVWLKEGDRVTVRVLGTPSSVVVMDIIDENGVTIDSNLTLQETESNLMDDFGDGFMGISQASKRSPRKGHYETTYVLRSGMVYHNARCRVRLTAQGQVFKTMVRGIINNFGRPRSVEITSELANIRNRPGRAYTYFLPEGVKCEADGRIGNQLRLRLGSNEGWIPMDQVKWLPPGSTTPSSVIPVIRIHHSANGSQFKLLMSERLPFLVRQTGPRTLEMTVFGGVSDTDWIRFIDPNPHIAGVRWTEDAAGSYRLIVDLNADHYWGYSASYEGTNLVWAIREKPKTRGLRGLTICVDPGHTPDIGSTGPRGTQERQVNVELAHTLRARLEKAGAMVVMTHDDTTAGLSLFQRIKVANASGAHAFVSLHHNAMPDRVNPFSQRFGPSMIYYHPQSKRLAEHIQQELVKRTKLPDFGVFQGNIAVCRNTNMPAVLVESVFLVLPDQERLALDKTFQETVARAIVDGLSKFFK